MDTQATFLPFHAINEFMRPDFRLNVIRSTLSALPSLPDNLRDPINRLTRRHVSVPGFRNSEKAPNLVKVVPMAKAFEKSPELVAAILAAWAEAHASLRTMVYEMLEARRWKVLPDEDSLNLEDISPELVKDWPILPIRADRTKVPGFFTRWPKGDDFETIYQSFAEKHPDFEASIDEVSLMVVWLSLRLPYNVEEEPPASPADPETNPAPPGDNPAVL